MRAQVELLRNPPDGDPATSSADDARDARNSHPSPPQAPANGYSPQAAASQDVARALSHHRPEAEAFIHPDLRATHGHAPTASMMPLAPPSAHSPGSSTQSASPNPALQPNSPAQPQNANLAPAPPPPVPSGGDTSPDGRSRPKRELSQSKRAAQNRAAQVGD